jgi:site-specific recombinase XerD
MMAWNETEGRPTTTDTFDSNATTWLNAHQTEWSKRTRARRLTALRKFAKVLHLTTNHLSEYRTPTPAKSRPHPLPEGIDGVVQMIETCSDPRRRATIALCGLAGLRLHEALSVRPSDINVASRIIRVHGKGDKDRDVPMSDRCYEHVRDCLVDAIVAGRNDEAMINYRDRFARELITRAGHDAGLARRVSSHDLRATFLTAAYNKSLDIRAVQELAGHASSTTTEGYIEVALTSLRSAADV